ncbi:MAG: hypothetical protein EA425_06985 [Puniceicoccaceae bacterium]|nr:MAG: hypothetical protein EA425_06985 [Puniceicoccaceae bacterium]
MSTDISRSTFRPSHQFKSVRMQQGRVLLDADWNEQVDLAEAGEAARLRDLVGPAGTSGDAFRLEPLPGASATTDLRITPGRYYVEGQVCDLPEAERLEINELEAGGGATVVTLPHLFPDGRLLAVHDWVELALGNGPAFRARVTTVDADAKRITLDRDIGGATPVEGLLLSRITTYTRQPFLPEPDFVAGDAPVQLEGFEIRRMVYLETFTRHLTALERPAIREVGLGGPDTTTRAQTVWQVKLADYEGPNGSNGSLDCHAPPPEWRSLVEQSSARLRARAHPEAPAALCDMPARAGYRRLENQLYRVEIHQAGVAGGGATLKWARDHASMAARWLGSDGDRLEVSFPGRDRFIGFAGGDYVELTDETRELQGRRGTLLPLLNVDGNVLIVDLDEADGPTDFSAFPNQPKIRRWDGRAAVAVPAENDGWLALEEGVEIQFEVGGRYQTGDYWQIPARTLTGDIEWPQNGSEPAWQPPDGVERHYALLGFLVPEPETGALRFDDRRARFSSLAAVDDRFKRRNRFLHGSGVVCGLQVRCDGDRRFVRVRPGYGFAPDGAESFLPTGRRHNVVDAARLAQLVGEEGKVDLVLRPGPDGEGELDLVPSAEDKGSFLHRALKGTLLSDILEGCLQPALAFFRSQLTGDGTTEDRFVTTVQRRQIAVFNLLVQLLVADEGRHVFLSREEHGLLEELYHALRGYLGSETFCGIDDDTPAFPSYPEELQRAPGRTVFGPGLGFMAATSQLPMRTLRYNENGTRAVAFGEGDAAFFINLENGELERSFAPVAGSRIQDAAFFHFGEQARVMVSSRLGANTTLTIANADDFSDRRDVALPGLAVARLLPHPSEDLMIALVPTRGMVVFHVNDFDAGQFQQPSAAFNPTGHGELVHLANGVVCVATASSGPGETTLYNRLVTLPLTGQATGAGGQINFPAGTVGADGFGLLLDSLPARATRATALRPRRSLAYIAVNGGGTGGKRVLVYDLGGRQAGTSPDTPMTPEAEVALQTSGPVSLCAAPDQSAMMVVTGDRFRLLAINPSNHTIDFEHFVPVQVNPSHLAVNPVSARAQVAVVNQTSNTITLVPAVLLSSDRTSMVEPLRAYRRALLDAYLGLGTRFLQHLKDCACGRLWRNCPGCPEVNHIVLATVTIRGGRVHHICHGHARKEVITVSKLLYWTSLIPVIPILTALVKEFCCLVLPDLLRNRRADTVTTAPDSNLATGGVAAATPPQPSTGGQRETVPQPTTEMNLAHFRTPAGVREISSVLSRTDLSQFLATNQARVSMAGTVLGGTLSQVLTRALQPREVVAAPNEIVNLDAAQAGETLAARGVVVDETVEMSRAIESEPLSRFVALPADLREGDHVRLFTESNRVVYYQVQRGGEDKTTEATPSTHTSAEVQQLSREIATMKTTYDNALVMRDKEIQDLRTELNQLRRQPGG